jgi:DNA-binding NarL/FixJ family response regulator
MTTVRVLIVDDQAPFRLAARMVTESAEDFETIAEAASGEASVELAERLMPDLVLMDVHLPGMDGWEATRRIRGGGAGQRPVVLLLSTYEAQDYGPRATECGAAGYVSKSDFDAEVLTAVWNAATRA